MDKLCMHAWTAWPTDASKVAQLHRCTCVLATTWNNLRQNPEAAMASSAQFPVLRGRLPRPGQPSRSSGEMHVIT